MKKLLLALLTSAGFVAVSFAQGPPVTDFSGTPTTICAGRAVTWTNLSTNINGNTTYNWSFPGSTNTSSTSFTPQPRTYNTPGTYSVGLVATNPGGGGGTDTEIKAGYITVIASPTITVSPTISYIGCSVTSTTLSASGGLSYTWSPAASLNTNTGGTVIASPTANTLYTVTGSNAAGCTAQAQSQVAYNNSPPPAPTSVTGLTTVCSGQSGVTYVVPGVTPPAPVRNWTVPAGATITAGQGTRSVTVTFGSTSGSVCCSQTNACGTSSVTCLGVTVNPTPSVGSTGTIVGPTSVCDNQTGVTYVLPAVANASSYTWTENSDATITSGQGTNTITVTFGTNNNTSLCVTPSNSCGSGSQNCINIVSSGAAPGIPGAISGPTTVCNGQSGVMHSVGFVAGATSYSWTVTSGATITAGQGTRSVTVTYGASTSTVCVAAVNGCGSSNFNCTTVTVDAASPVGAIGSMTGISAVCANQSGVTYSIPTVTNATSYNWTVPATASVTAGSGTNSITVTFGTTSGNVCVDALNGCSTTSTVCTAVTVDPNAPTIPGAITGPTTVCSGATGVNYSVAAVPNTTTYNWTLPTGASITAGAGTNTITVTFGSTSGTVCVTTSNSCGTSLGSCQVVTVDAATAVGTVGSIAGPAAVCANQSNITYFVGAVSGATTYSWTVPGTASVTAGQGTNSITVTFGSTAGNVCVFASNSCSQSSPNCVAVTVDAAAPTIPGAISGVTTVCSGQGGEVYTVAAVANATTYNWTVPAGASITSGQGTETIVVTFGSSSGTVSVTAGNACGTSLASSQVITVDPNPVVGTIGNVNGPTAVCANQSNVIFSTPAVNGASTYSWTVPATATVTAGQGTNTITVTFGGTAGNVCVSASNPCSATAQSCAAVSVAASAPGIPGAITGVTTVCNGQLGESYTVGSVANATVYTWSTPSGGSVTGGQGTTSVTVNFGSTSGNISVTAGNACGTSLASTLAINVDPTPAVGTIGTIVGPTAACANQSNVTYVLPAVANATNYQWTVPSAANITAGQGTNTITVTFGNVSGNICVGASNSCGASPQSCIAVNVSPNAPAIPSGITGATTVCSGQVGNYSTNPVANATSYSWTVPSGASVSAGQGTTNVTVNFGTTSGNVCVSASNGCGTSLQNCQAVTVSSAVLTVSTTVVNTSNSSVCDGGATAIPAGGTGPYTYAWTPSGDVTATVSGLCFGTHTVCVTDAAGCVTCTSVNVSSPVGVNTLTDNGTIKVFPNPANDHIFIEGTLNGSANLRISVVSVFGQKLMDQQIHADGTFSHKMSIEGIPSGVYFIQISADGMVRNTRIIKIQ